MSLKDKIRLRNFEEYWDKKGRRDMFTWMHRYLRLHSELLVDSDYKKIYDYCLNTLIAYIKKDGIDRKVEDSEIGDLIEVLADIFNRDNVEYVNKYKPVVDELYNCWKEYPTANEIRV